MTSTTACALLYGDYSDLAERCLSSLWRHFPPSMIRIWANAPGSQTVAYLGDLVRRGYLLKEQTFVSTENILKYPAMRHLFYGSEHVKLPPIATKHVMWLDDDSYIHADAGGDWLASVEAAIGDAVMLGSMYRLRDPLTKNQQAWVKDQPWYTGKPVDDIPEFLQGAWWLAKTEFLTEFGWPIGDLRHNGGDVMLGVLARQQRRTLKHWRNKVGINADKDGRESRAKRRGTSEPPVGSNHKRGRT